MEQLRKLNEVRLAYRQASFWKIARAAYSVDVKWLQITLWFFSFLSIIAVIWFAIIKDENPKYFIFILFLVTAILFSKSLQSVYSSYYSVYPDILESYRKNRLFLRYLIFKSNVNPSLIGNESKINEIQKLLDSEKNLYENTIFITHPVSVTCIGLITAILGGAASQVSNWGSGLMPIIIFFLLLIIFVNYQVTEIFQTKSYKDKELRQFLTWLSLDEN